MKKFDSVEDLKADWKRIDRALIPPNLLVSMPQPECKGLTMLTDVMINATVCKLGPRAGQITAPYSDGIEIVLDVAETIEHRMRRPEFGRHLETSVRSLETGASIEVCIVAIGYQGAPAIDDCVSFVLWAETGFFEPPRTLDDKILYVRDPELYERRAMRKRLAYREQKERRDLVIIQRRARYQAQQDLELERQRIRNLGWRELVAEHESTLPPTDAISDTLYHLRTTLLSMPAPGHTIGHTLERREPKEDSK